MAATRKTTKRVKPKTGRATATKKVTRKTVAKKAAVKKTAAPKKTVAAKAASKPKSFSTDAVRDVLSNSASEAQKFQQEALAMSREGAEQFAKGADVASRSLTEAVELSKENVEACVECSNIAAGLSKTLSGELVNAANQTFAQNVEMSKELFACRTLNDMFDLQTKMMKNNMEQFFSNSVKLSELVFKGAGEVSAPLNECVNASSERFKKALVA